MAILNRKQGLMLRSLRVGRFFGIDVYLHFSFWALPIFYILMTRSFSLVTAAFAIAFVFVMSFCIVLHEFGHVLTARAFGIATRDIILTPLGGIARLERMSEKPVEEILIALAGPAVNVVIVAVMAPLLYAIGMPKENVGNGIGNMNQFVWTVAGANVMLVLFNMLPAFPLDGGRVFRAFLSFFTDRLTATRVAVYVSFGFAALMAMGVFIGAYSLLLIAGFIVMAGQLELMMLKRVEEVRRRAKAEGDALPF